MLHRIDKNFEEIVKFMYFEKAIKFSKSSNFYMKFLSSVKKSLEILSYFVAFSEYIDVFLKWSNSNLNLNSLKTYVIDG